MAFAEISTSVHSLLVQSSTHIHAQTHTLFKSHLPLCSQPDVEAALYQQLLGSSAAPTSSTGKVPSCMHKQDNLHDSGQCPLSFTPSCSTSRHVVCQCACEFVSLQGGPLRMACSPCTLSTHPLGTKQPTPSQPRNLMEGEGCTGASTDQGDG